MGLSAIPWGTEVKAVSSLYVELWESVVWTCSGEKGKLLLGLRRFPEVFLKVLKCLGAWLWEESVFESSAGFLLDNFQDVSFCGLLCVKHPFPSCCIQQHSRAVLV